MKKDLSFYLKPRRITKISLGISTTSICAALFLLILFFCGLKSFATTYTYTANSPSGGWQSIRPKWTDQARWDTYPGTTINAGDVVLIYGLMYIDGGIVNNGSIVVKNRYESCIPVIGCFTKDKGEVKISPNAIIIFLKLPFQSIEPFPYRPITNQLFVIHCRLLRFRCK